MQRVGFGEAVDGGVAGEVDGALEAIQPEGESVWVMGVAAEEEVAVFEEPALDELAGAGGRRVGEALEVALEEEAEVFEIRGEIGVVLGSAHALGVG